MADVENKTTSIMTIPLRKGCDPRAATCRGKLQTKRSKLNMEINKELMLRSGAENLFKATTNKKMKETIALELSFVNSNLQLLKEQLAELNSCVEVYQKDSNKENREIPMIPLGLKETKEIDFREPFMDFILEHYSVDGADYENSIAEFMDLRQAMRTPTRDQNGIALLFQHFNQLYYVERRFFPPDRHLGIFFEWYDSLTGVPSCQRTVAFEKAAVLFNIAALYTQIGTRQDRSQQDGLDQAVDNFLRAAGTFQYIHENFTNAPSMDLRPDTLEMLVHLMCAQARECLFEKSELLLKKQESSDGESSEEDQHTEVKDGPGKEITCNEVLELCLLLAQEAAHVSEVFSKVVEVMSQSPVNEYVPDSWISLTQVKREHYKALSHYYTARGLLGHSGLYSNRVIELLQFLHDGEQNAALLATQTSLSALTTLERSKKGLSKKKEAGASQSLDMQIPQTSDEKRYLGKAHLREALLLHEEAMRINRMSRELRKKEGLQNILRSAHERSLGKYATVDEEDDFQEVLDPPSISPQTQYQLSLAFPDLARHKVTDLFATLGPVAVFNAKQFWTAPRPMVLRKRDHEGFGFSVRGDAPVIVAGVDRKSAASNEGMKEGDYIVAINSHDVKWLPHDQVVSLIKQAGNKLDLKVVTPLSSRHDKQNSPDRSFESSSLLTTSPTLASASTTSSARSHSSSGSSFSSRHDEADQKYPSPFADVPKEVESGRRGQSHVWNRFRRSHLAEKTVERQ